MSQTSVYVVTAHGRQELQSHESECLIDVLTRYRIPWSGTSIYVREGSSGSAILRPCLSERLNSFSDRSEILIYFNRNVNPFQFDLSGASIIPSENHGAEATEYFYQKFDNRDSSVSSFLKKLSADECRQAVSDSVSETLRNIIPENASLIVGVSGGGDSNALLYSLSRLKNIGLEIHPIIIMGTPEWDAGVPRAAELCRNYGLELTVYNEDQVKGLLGMQGGGPSLVDCFEAEFTGDDFEFLGTLLVRLALFEHAKNHSTNFVCTGLNLEDIACESLFRISNGMNPASFPVRSIGDFRLVFPLWMMPKRIIDGCFPKWSQENYDARYPCFSLGRNFYYSVINQLQSQFPGYLEQLARSLSELSQRDPVDYRFDEELGFHVERLVPFPLLERFRRMMKRAGR